MLHAGNFRHIDAGLAKNFGPELIQNCVIPDRLKTLSTDDIQNYPAGFILGRGIGEVKCSLFYKYPPGFES